MLDPTGTDSTLPLETLYLHLVRTGFPLSPRDYGDALRAIRAGHGVGRREDLHVLLRQLWARGDEDLVRMDAVFRRFARPTPEEVETLTGTGVRAAKGADTLQRSCAASEDDAAAGEAAGLASTGVPRAEFAPAGESGLGLPSARTSGRATRPFVFEPRATLAERSFVIAWRRLRRPKREGPAVELDVDATVAEQCRIGWMLHPVLVPARRNLTRLLVLADASPSMLPWCDLHEPLAASLRQSRLASSALMYFDNDPRDGLYATPRLDGRFDCEATLREHGSEYSLIVLGDAGSVRGRGDRSRLVGTRRFVVDARRYCGALAWLNPMPAGRWRDAAVALRPGGQMFELSDDGLTQAVDHLRGLQP